MKLTEEHIQSARSSNGGWSAEQLVLFGVRFPLWKGWKWTIVGRDFPQEVIEKFIALKDAHLPKPPVPI